MSIFRDMGPTLSDDHTAAKAMGRHLQVNELETLFVRWGIRISSAIRVEMTDSKCTYEEACVNFVRACDEIARDFHFISWAEEVRAEDKARQSEGD